MARPPAKPKKPPSTSAPPSEGEERQSIPQKTVEILNHRLGIDVSTVPPDQISAVIGAITQSRSFSPYTSAEMLQAYKDRGFPWLVDKVIGTIDKENSHRQELEYFVTRKEQGRLDRAQFGAQAVSVLGVVGSLVAGYFGVPVTICVVTASVSIGGPPAATIIARILDLPHKDK